MTGIERLRELAGGIRYTTKLYEVTSSEYDWKHNLSSGNSGGYLRDVLADITDQIEREVTPHERRDEPADGHSADVSVSAYDLPPEDEREAIAWVREHGGIAYVRDAWDVRSNLARQLETAKAKVERQQRHIESIQSKLRDRRERIEELNRELDELDDICGGESVKDTLDEALNLCATIGCEPSSAVGEELIWALGECTDIVSKRLMPEGMEWMLWDDGKPVTYDDAPDDVIGVYLALDGSGYALMTDLPDQLMSEPGERVKRPAPKVLDADGVEIRVGDTVWDVEYGCEHVVTKVADDAVFAAFEDESADKYDPMTLTHRAPVLAADGKPLREGETVWVTRDSPCDAPLAKGDEVTVKRVYTKTVTVEDEVGASWIVFGDHLTHERPDSWERLEEDVAGASCPDVYCANHHIDASDASYEWAMARDIVRRAKALAGGA